MCVDFEKPKFKLWIVSIIAGIVWFFFATFVNCYPLFVARGHLKASASSDLITQMISTAVFPILMAYFLGWCFYRITRRNRIVGNLVFLAFYALPLLIFVTNVNEGRRRNQVMAESAKDARAASQKVRDNILQQYEEGDSLTTASAQAFSEISSMSEKYSKEDGIVGQAYRVMGKAAKEMQEYVVPVNESLEKIQALDEISSETTQDDLKERIDRLREMQSSTQNLISFLENYKSNIQKSLNDEKIPSHMHASFISSYDSPKAPIRDHIAYRKTVVQFAEDSIAFHEFLLNHWGEWEIGDEQAEFTDKATESAIKQFGELAERLGKSQEIMIEAEEAWNAKLFDRLKRK